MIFKGVSVQVARLNPEKSIPAAVLRGARGLAILTVAKGGVLLSYKLGSGLVVARRSDGSWSAPSAILSVGLGWGAQVCNYFTGLPIQLLICLYIDWHIPCVVLSFPQKYVKLFYIILQISM